MVHLEKLSNEQLISIDKFNNGDSFFLTGEAGTGKTFIIKKFNEIAISNQKNIKITALTGVAALLLDCNACTIHSFCGIGTGKKTKEQLLFKINSKKEVLKKIKNIEILIIDEVSMMSLELFNKLNFIFKNIRKNYKLFGGIQIIFCGDFFQLPPVDSVNFCFESEEFNNLDVIQLKTIFRQNDNVYKSLLNNIRVGKIKKSQVKLLQSKITNSDLDIINICATKKETNNINQSKLNKLINENNYQEYNFSRKYNSDNLKESNYSKEEIETEMNYIKNNTLTEENLKLIIGAKVMCIINLNDFIVNGSIGVIIKFINGYPLVRFENDYEYIFREHSWESETLNGLNINQIPLIYAWAITIHKSQGITLDKANISVGEDIFESGQVYVALSRVKNLEGLYLKNFAPHKILINKKVLNFYKHIN